MRLIRPLPGVEEVSYFTGNLSCPCLGSTHSMVACSMLAPYRQNRVCGLLVWGLFSVSVNTTRVLFWISLITGGRVWLPSTYEKCEITSNEANTVRYFTTRLAGMLKKRRTAAGFFPAPVLWLIPSLRQVQQQGRFTRLIYFLFVDFRRFTFVFGKFRLNISANIIAVI